MKALQKVSSAPRSPIQQYLTEINEAPLLTKLQERELIERSRSGDEEARQTLITSNLRLVVNIAKSFVGNAMSLQDAIEEGNLGLMEAVEKFDLSFNTKFSTYASYWIKKNIKRAIVNTGYTVRVPVYLWDTHSKIKAVTQKTNGEAQHDTIGTAAESLGIKKQKIRNFKRARHFMGNATEDGPDQDRLGSVKDQTAKNPLESAEHHEMLYTLTQILDVLDSRERAIIEMRFELNNQEKKTLKEVGEFFSITKERVRQIETAVLRKCRLILEGKISLQELAAEQQAESAGELQEAVA